MKINKSIIRTFILLLLSFHFSCEDVVSIDAPTDKLVRAEVFSNDETAISAMDGIYNELHQAEFSSGSRSSVTVLAGLSSDNVQYLNSGNITMMEFQDHEIAPTNSGNLELWTSAYNIIYLCNSYIEGLTNSTSIDAELQQQLEGEARFVRAFTYFYLVNLYEIVPLILDTDYRVNALKPQAEKEEIYTQIENDLQFSSEILNTSYRNSEKTSVNKFVAKAFLARVYLFLGDWQEAERLSTEVIQESASYEILENLDDVFLANSREAIWQISPIGGGGIVSHTNDGSMFVIDPFFSFFSTLKLDESLVEEFSENDLRREKWIGYNTSLNAFFSHKYKISSSTQFPIQEYSMVLRLAEQYLIRAEARLKMNEIDAAVEDLDVIRRRADLPLLAEINPGISGEALLEEIYIQRRKELFTEWGHRWFDLKRSGNIDTAFHSNPTWEMTDSFYPIPSEEISKNPNLIQNDGY
ncbi:RagB/SusD family nutrient uptake outer membrane protein [Salegentibacter sp. JZCK2]|uniref:RagB/SusD family nutrient uptake outer membrane protein n=1 Tax=Salegentibacter tibetensis TaxID=2873600 RepID=UPI001CCD60CC|nr:RagB/SusD family nutrient uptake outer membrane protein [Salegentibacter tibetensis]MBZ9731113.1 RagB/SusD family nutrient uptake outer membrane protein [Salegentibacter tibetensis]